MGLRAAAWPRAAAGGSGSTVGWTRPARHGRPAAGAPVCLGAPLFFEPLDVPAPEPLDLAAELEIPPDVVVALD